MKSIRISEHTYDRLVEMKHGMETMDEVIGKLLRDRVTLNQLWMEKERARTALEADRAKDC